MKNAKKNMFSKLLKLTLSESRIKQMEEKLREKQRINNESYLHKELRKYRSLEVIID